MTWTSAPEAGAIGDCTLPTRYGMKATRLWLNELSHERKESGKVETVIKEKVEGEQVELLKEDRLDLHHRGDDRALQRARRRAEGGGGKGRGRMEKTSKKKQECRKTSTSGCDEGALAPREDDTL